MSDANLLELTALTRIARHLATEEHTLEQIFKIYEIDQEYFDTYIAPNPYFKRVLEDYTKEWQSLGSSQKRLAFSALTALEEKLPVLAQRMGDRGSALADAVAVGKLFRELAGIAAPSGGQAVGQGTPFTISINFGTHKVALDAQPVIDAEKKPALEAPNADTKNSIVGH